MTIRVATTLVVLASGLALAKLSAADRAGENITSAPFALAHPSADGHPLPEEKGWNPPTYSLRHAVSDEIWRTNINEQLDASLARLQGEGREQPAALLVTTWGQGTFDPTSSPAVTTPVGSGRQAQQTMIARLLQKHGLPAGLTSVAAVESAFNPLALSTKGARGLWQLMPATARLYGLRVEPEADDRIDALKSTQAAAAYIKDLYGQFQDWPLVLAAYNAGEHRVARAMARTGARDFWTLRRHGALPDETLRYVPAVLEKLEFPLDTPEAERSNSPSAPGQIESPAGRIAYATPARHE